MLLPKMTHEEERSEILKDLPNVQRWEEHRWKEFRRMSFKMKDFPKYVFNEYVSPRNNRWIVTTRFYGKDDFASTFGVLQVLNGLVLHQVFCSFDEEHFSTLVTFIPHFFDRYREYNKLDLKGIPLIKQMLKDGCSFNVDKTQSVSGRRELERDDNVHCCMSHGVGLGYELGYRHFLIKTYVTYEMSTGHQKEVFQATRDDLTRRFASPPPLSPRKSVFIPLDEIKKAIKKYGKLHLL